MNHPNSESKSNASEKTDASKDAQLIETQLKSETKYQGNIIRFDCMTVRLPNGATATRDVIVHPGASAIVPYEEGKGIYLVRQFRSPVGKLLWELPAGRLDKDEDPLDCAIRELREETGLLARNMIPLTSLVTAPGFSNEIVHLFLATGLSQSEAACDPDEFVSVRCFDLSTCLAMVQSHEIDDAKTITGILMTQLHLKQDNSTV